jgi:nucleotide-binding universal stress UspA family protein
METEHHRPPILVGFDGTAQAHDALELGRVAIATLGGRLEIASVLEIESAWLGGEPDDAHLADLEAETTRLVARRLDGIDYEVQCGSDRRGRGSTTSPSLMVPRQS